MSAVEIFDPSTNVQSASFVRNAYVKRLREHADIVVKHIREVLEAQEFLDDPELLHLQSGRVRIKFNCTAILNDILNRETYQTLCVEQLKYIAIQFDHLGWTTYYSERDKCVTLESERIEEDLV